MADFVWVVSEDGKSRESVPLRVIERVLDCDDGKGYKVYAREESHGPAIPIGRVYSWPPEPEAQVPAQGWSMLQFFDPTDPMNSGVLGPEEIPIIAWSTTQSGGVKAVLINGDHCSPENNLEHDGDVVFKALRDPDGKLWIINDRMEVAEAHIRDLIEVAADWFREIAEAKLEMYSEQAQQILDFNREQQVARDEMASRANVHPVNPGERPTKH